ncbi:MAG: hypothetical protein RSC29_00010 [Oscillospiraceae bacterium]
MKNCMKIAFVYIGLIIGAGFASGREIMQYFNFRSNTDLSGTVLAGLLFILMCFIILDKAYRQKLYNFDDYISSIAGNFKKFIKAFMLFYLFCGFFVMLSGSGTLFRDTLNVPLIIGILFMACVCFIVFAFDIKGIVMLNVILVPLMLGGILYICTVSVILKNAEVFNILENVKNNMLTSAICYVSYNTITAAAVLVPLSKTVNKNEIIKASFVGGGVLGILIFIIWLAQAMYFKTLWYSEIPMLTLAAFHGDMSKVIYSLVLLMAICTTAVSQGFGIMSYFKATSFKQRLICGIIICVVAIPFAMLGFGNLVEHLYTFFGYAGLLWMGWVIVDYCKNCLRE